MEGTKKGSISVKGAVSVSKLPREVLKVAKSTVSGKAALGRAPKPRTNRIKLLVSITNLGDEVRIAEICNEFSVALAFSSEGVGTAQSSILNYLGLGETEKGVLVALIPESDEEKILREIANQMSMYMVGRGISFTVPVSAISEIIAKGLTEAATEKTMDGSKIMKEQDRQFELIVAVVNAGSADEAMDAARSAGAAGGTILRARTLNNEKAKQFIGISLQLEQEILLIIARKESKLAIMNAINEKAGVKTQCGAKLFALPVDRTVGIGADTAAASAETTDAERSDE